MILFRRMGAKNRYVYARLYLRDHQVVVRFYLNDVTKYELFIRNTTSFIKVHLSLTVLNVLIVRDLFIGLERAIALMVLTMINVMALRLSSSNLMKNV